MGITYSMHAGEDMRTSYKVLVGNTERKRSIRAVDVDRMIILRFLTGIRCFKIESNGGCCDHGNEPPVSIKSGEFQLSDCQVLCGVSY